MSADEWTAADFEASADALECGMAARAVPAVIDALRHDGLTNRHAAAVLRALAAERRARQDASERTKLVWTGPAPDSATLRMTSVVVEELFETAEHSVLVSSYAVHQGAQIFAPLHRRMTARPGIKVRLFLNIPRAAGDVREPEAIVRAFERELAIQWPWTSRPEASYDPRSLELDAGGKPSLHAKCVVVDDRRALVTSANLTEAAQERNIELGVLLDDPVRAAQIRALFDALALRGRLVRLSGF